MKKAFLSLFLVLAVVFTFTAQQTGGQYLGNPDIGDEYIDCHYVPEHEVEVPILFVTPFGVFNTGFTTTVTVPGSYQGSDCASIGLND